MATDVGLKQIGVVLVGIALLITGSAVAAPKVQVSSAVWKADRNELRIEGSAVEPDEVVLVRDADTKAFVGSAAVRGDGKWMLKVRNPKSVPAKLRVECLGTTAECPVECPTLLQ